MAFVSEDLVSAAVISRIANFKTSLTVTADDYPLPEKVFSRLEEGNFFLTVYAVEGLLTASPIGRRPRTEIVEASGYELGFHKNPTFFEVRERGLSAGLQPIHPWSAVDIRQQLPKQSHNESKLLVMTPLVRSPEYYKFIFNIIAVGDRQYIYTTEVNEFKGFHPSQKWLFEQRRPS